MNKYIQERGSAQKKNPTEILFSLIQLEVICYTADYTVEVVQ